MKSLSKIFIVLCTLVLSTLSFAGETIYYIQTDHLGAPAKITNNAQTTVWEKGDDAFGESAPKIETITFNMKFPGQYYDAESGLHYNWNRYYDPETGRYVTSDPIGLQGGLNTYGYVSGNPLVRTDPTGEYWKLIFEGCKKLWKWIKPKKKPKKKKPSNKPDPSPERERICLDRFLTCLNNRSVEESLCHAAVITCRNTNGPMIFPGAPPIR